MPNLPVAVPAASTVSHNAWGTRHSFALTVPDNEGDDVTLYTVTVYRPEDEGEARTGMWSYDIAVGGGDVTVSGRDGFGSARAARYAAVAALRNLVEAAHAAWMRQIDALGVLAGEPPTPRGDAP